MIILIGAIREFHVATSYIVQGFSSGSGITRAVGLFVTALLASCGGDSDSGGNMRPQDGAVELVAKDDVVRELRIVNYFVTYGDGEAEYIEPFGMAKRRIQRMRDLPSSKDGASDTQCESGSVSYVDGAKLRDFVYFDASRQVDYTVGTLESCKRTDIPGVDAITYDGTLEDGESADGQYTYLLSGDGRTPALITVEQDGALFHQGVLGLVETRSTSALSEQRQVTRYNFDHDGGSAIVGEFGKIGEPFVETDGGGRYTVDGSYRYQSTECEGGNVGVTTESPIVIVQGYPRGGVLRFTSGQESATVEIRSDGGATLFFADGTDASISADEMRRIYDDFETECVLDRFAGQERS